MQVQLISAEIFEQRQESFESANFLQTRQQQQLPEEFLKARA